MKNTEEPERKFPHAVVRCLRFKGLDKVHIIDDKTFGGPLYQQYLNAISWIESKLEVEYIIEGVDPRKEIWDIPLDAFKEALCNAICHRDLYEEGATIMVEVYDDRVEISNPGGRLPLVAENFGAKNMSRNPLIFGLFTRMHIVEKVGSGVPRMRRLMKEAGLPEPEFENKGFFTVRFTKRNPVYRVTDDTINEYERNILSLIISKPGISAVQIAADTADTDKSIITAKRGIKTLVDNKIIEYRGSKKTGGYYLLGES